LCSDFWPHGEVAQRYSVLRRAEPALGASDRAVFVISREGQIVLRRIYDLSELPELDEILNALQRV
jgi:peroxiredoxin